MKDGARLTWSSGMVVVIFATLVVANVFGQTVGGKPVNIDFSPEMAKQFEWSLKQGDKEYLRLGQRVGRDGQEIVGVAVYGGLPFASSSLTVKGDLEVPLMIKIIGAKNRELTPYSGPQNLDGMISYTWRLKTGGPSGKNEKELSAII